MARADVLGDGSASDGAPFVRAVSVDRRERGVAGPRDQEQAGVGLDSSRTAHVGQRRAGDRDVTREFANWLGTTLSGEAAGPSGDIGDEPSPPHAATSVASVAQDAGLAGACAELAS